MWMTRGARRRFSRQSGGWTSSHKWGARAVPRRRQGTSKRESSCALSNTTARSSNASKARRVSPPVEVCGFARSVLRLKQCAVPTREAHHPEAYVCPDAFHLHKGGSWLEVIRHLSGSLLAGFHWNDSPPVPSCKDDHGRAEELSGRLYRALEAALFRVECHLLPGRAVHRGLQTESTPAGSALRHEGRAREGAGDDGVGSGTIGLPVRKN